MSIDEINNWADFWRYNIGVNVIPADTVNKRMHEKWSEWQDSPISELSHEQWKNNNAFSRGMAIILGKIWHRKDRKDYYFVFIDADNQKAIEAICSVFGVSNLQELSQFIIVEQHIDDLSKAHFYFYSKDIFKKKSSDAAKFADSIRANEIPAIEVKGLGSHGIAYCTPSIHKNGFNYEIIGTREPNVYGKEIEEKLEVIYKKYNLITGAHNNGKTPIQLL